MVSEAEVVQLKKGRLTRVSIGFISGFDEHFLGLLSGFHINAKGLSIGIELRNIFRFKRAGCREVEV